MLVYLAAARCPCFWCCCWLNNPNDTVEYEVWYVYFRHTLHIYFAQALWQGEVQYDPEDQKYTTSIHVAYSVLLFYLDCFKTGNCLGSLRVNRVGQSTTGVWLLLFIRAILMDWIPMLMAMYWRNITHTHTHFHILRISGSSLYSPGASNQFLFLLLKGYCLESNICFWIGDSTATIWVFPKMVVPNNHGFPY